MTMRKHKKARNYARVGKESAQSRANDKAYNILLGGHGMASPVELQIMAFQKMMRAIAAQQTQYTPVLSPKGTVRYFTRKRVLQTKFDQQRMERAAARRLSRMARNVKLIDKTA